MTTDLNNSRLKSWFTNTVLVFLLLVSQAAQSANRLVISGVPALQAVVGSVYTFTPQIKGSNQNKLKLRVLGRPAWASFDGKTGVLSGIPAASHIGTPKKAIIISVSDSKGGKAKLKSFKITVVKGLPNQPVNSGTATPAPGVASTPDFHVVPQPNNPVIGNMPGISVPTVSNPGNNTQPQPQAPTAEYQLALKTGDASNVTVEELLSAGIAQAQSESGYCTTELGKIYPAGLQQTLFPTRSAYLSSNSSRNIPLHAANNNGSIRVYSWMGKKETGTPYAVLGTNVFSFTTVNTELKDSTMNLFRWL